MRSVSQTAVFIAHVAVGIFAITTAANAGTLQVSADTTLVSSNSGDDAADGAPDADAGLSSLSVNWAATGVDVLINTGLTFTGGNGGAGGPDASNDGGNGGSGGSTALNMGPAGSAGTLTASGIFIHGGSGGAGSDGGTAGAGDTAGGSAGAGGVALKALGSTLQISLADTIASGGAGGNGGAAGDVAGDLSQSTSGGAGGDGGMGVQLFGVGNLVNFTGTNLIKGGHGGAGGASLANATNASGGDGGVAVFISGSSHVITIGAGTTVQGGTGGASGTGGNGTLKGLDAFGVFFQQQGAGSSLKNHGAILGSAANDQAAIFIAADTTLIDNYGTIGATAGHNGYAVFAAADALTTFRNRASGLIQSTGTNPTVEVYSTVANFINEGSIINSGAAAGVRLLGGVGIFTNSGTIHSNNSSALTISNAGVADIIDNTGGTISNTSLANAAVSVLADLGAAGITFKGGEISNSGGFAAIAVTTAQTGNIGVENATIGGGVLFLSADETLNVANSIIDGDVVFAGGTNNLNFLLGGTTTLQAGTQFVDTDFFSVLAGATVVSDAEQTDANSSIGKVTTIAGGSLTLNEDFWADAEVLNQGSIAVATGRTLTANKFSGGGTYAFGVTDDTTLAKIEAQGAGSSLDFTGASFDIKLTNPSASFVAGCNFLLAEDLNGNAILGLVNGSLATDNSALLSIFVFRGDAAEIGLTSDLLFAQVQVALLADIAGEGDDPNSIALGAALDAIGLDGDADLDDLMLDLALLGTNKEINDVLDALLPETDGVAYDIATDAGDQMLHVASRRLDGLRGSASASLEYRVASMSLLGLRGTSAPAAGRQFWGQAFGRAVDQSKHAYNHGYDAGSYGFAVGADTALDNATSLGAAFSHASTNADDNGINRTDTDVDSYQLTLYGDHLFDNRMYAKGLLAYGWHQNDIARHDVGGIPGNTASGGYDASQFNVLAEIGRAYAGGGNLTLIPRATLNAAWYSPDGYSEQGVGGLGLTVAPEDLVSARLGMGVLARWEVTLSGGELFQPELRLDYRRDLTQERFETTAEFLGAPGIAFRTQGAEPAADILDLGVGALLATASGIDIRASYDLELKEDYIAHAGYVRASVPF